ALSINSSLAGGGGGGAYVSSTVCVVPNQSVNYSIGSGGLGSNTLKHGGDTWFVDSSTVLAKGGTGTNTSIGGEGGAAEDSIGDVKISGQSGTNGTESLSGSGGNAGYTATVGSIGAGNTGEGGIGVTENKAGNNGTNYGGGGSGGKTTLISNNGGTGAQGVIRVAYYVQADITSIIANPTYCASENNIMLTATKSEGLENFSTLWFEGGNPVIHFTNQFVSVTTNLSNTTATNNDGVLSVTSTTFDPYIAFDN